MIISERIFYVMEQKNITQLELSRRTGIATSNISDWKKKKTNPKADCLLSICDACLMQNSVVQMRCMSPFTSRQSRQYMSLTIILD